MHQHHDDNTGFVETAPDKVEPATTEPKGDQTFPQKKQTKKAAQYSRVVVVSPYAQLNVFLEYEIPKHVEGGLVDVVSESTQDYPPYFNVDQHELLAQKPLWVIDFQKIIIDQPSPEYLAKVRFEALKSYVTQYIDEFQNNKPMYDLFKKPNLSIDDARELFAAVGFIDEKPEQDLLNYLEEASKPVANNHLVKGIANFLEYTNWSKRDGVTLVTPKAEFAEDMLKRCVYDKDGNFQSTQVYINDHLNSLKIDLKALASKSKQLKMFSVYK